MNDLKQRILEELVYQRVRASVNLCQLVIFEEELDKGIRRALVSSSEPRAEPSELARELIAEAWKRLEREWDTLRCNIDPTEED